MNSETAAEGPFTGRDRNRLIVLQVEDSESDAALVERSLEKAGFHVECRRVETAEEMQAALAQQAWDVIIADYHLPRFNAELALQVLQASGRDIPFIVVSGMVGEDVAVDMMKRGVHDFVMKSSLTRLAAAVDRERNEALIRERRRVAEAALRESERQFRELAESIPQLVWITDAGGKLIYSNTRLQQEFGLVQPGQPIERQFTELLYPEDRETFLAAWSKCFSTQKEFERECRLCVTSREYRWFLLRAIPVLDQLGNVTRWFGTSTDIDDQKRTQEHLTQVNLELRRSNSMLEQFAHITSHDLQEPLRTVTLYAQLLTTHCQDNRDPETKEFLQVIAEGTQRMTRLVADLLTISKAGRPDRELVPANLEQVLDEALKNLRASIQESGASVTRGPLPTVTADFGQLTQLLQNLLANALKYRKDDVAPAIDISSQQRPLEWVIAIRDNGIGINARYFERIFGVFKRLDTQGKYTGTGIGLSICKRIVERHQGRIWLESEEGVGSTFYFTLPVWPRADSTPKVVIADQSAVITEPR
jgi:PAS domain S-box-containing protein